MKKEDIEKYIVRCAKAGISAPTLRKILGLKVKEFESYENLYEENFNVTKLTLSELAVEKAQGGNDAMLSFYLKTKGNWVEGSRASLDEDFFQKPFSAKMEILDKLLAAGQINVQDYAKIAKVQLERFGAEEAITKFNELQQLCRQLMEKNKELLLELEKYRRGNE